jgi:hypothetical protein
MKSYLLDALLCASMALYICNLLWGMFVYKAYMLVSNDGNVYGLWLPSTNICLQVSIPNKKWTNS